MARMPSIVGEVLIMFLKPRHVSFARKRISFMRRLLRIRSRSSGVLRTAAVAGVVWPGRMRTAKLVALGEVVALEAAMSPSCVLLGAGGVIAWWSVRESAFAGQQHSAMADVWSLS